MNESETRAELIDPKLRENGWVTDTAREVKVFREFRITNGKIRPSGGHERGLTADYVLAYKNRKLAVVEAKSNERPVGEGVAQAKDYAMKLHLNHTYATNGIAIYHINMATADEGTVENYHTPDELWQLCNPVRNEWQEKFDDAGYVDKTGNMGGRFYQEIAVNNVMDAIAKKESRILLTMATGTGKTFIAFQIAWKLHEQRWNVHYDGKRRPRILFLADRNILANQAFNAFSAFPESDLVRISPADIRKRKGVPTSGNLFFTIFQTFMSGPNGSPYFGDYPPDFFDLIFVDECHRGGASDESTWRNILTYFAPAVQIGLTATPKRKVNLDTYKYFGEPVYIYSLKEGINDGFLTPFKVKRVETDLDEYTYDPDDELLEGDIEEGKTYKENDFNRIIEIKAREQKRVQILMGLINQKEKTLVFCATQDHAAAIRDLINQYKTSKEALYCVRVTANDGELGEQYLREFQDNEKSIPTILTTSRKLSTGIDARNIRNIVLLRPVNDMVEFKQIIGRGTRLFDEKNYFTIYDFVKATEKFVDPDWDGPPEPPDEQPPVAPPSGTPEDPLTVNEPYEPGKEYEPRPKVRVKLAAGKEILIGHTVTTTFWAADGTQISVEEYIKNLYGALPSFFNNEAELRELWADPQTRQTLLEKLDSAGIKRDDLVTLQKLIEAEHSDLFDVLEYIAFQTKPISREFRAAKRQAYIFENLNDEQKQFIDFVLNRYVQTGVEELDQDKLPTLLQLKYHAISDATERLGNVSEIRRLFTGFQLQLYGVRT